MCNRNEKNVCKGVSREKERERNTSGNRTRSSPEFSSRFGAPLVFREERRQCKKNKGFLLLSRWRMPLLASHSLPRVAFLPTTTRLLPPRAEFPLSVALLLDLSSRELLKGKHPRNPFSTDEAAKKQAGRGDGGGGGNSRILIARGSRHCSSRGR